MKNKEKYVKDFIEKLSKMTTHDLAEFINFIICDCYDCFSCPAHKYCNEIDHKIKNLEITTKPTCIQILEGWLDKEIEELTEENNNEKS